MAWCVLEAGFEQSSMQHSLKTVQASTNQKLGTQVIASTGPALASRARMCAAALPPTLPLPTTPNAGLQQAPAMPPSALLLLGFQPVLVGHIVR